MHLPAYLLIEARTCLARAQPMVLCDTSIICSTGGRNYLSGLSTVRIQIVRQDLLARITRADR